MKVVFDLSVTSAFSGRTEALTNWDAAWTSPNSNTSPGLVLDFAAGVYGAGGIFGPLSSTLSLIRNSEGTRFDPSGIIDLIAPNVTRMDHDPVTLAPRGLLLEPESTILLSQSDAPNDQTIRSLPRNTSCHFMARAQWFCSAFTLLCMRDHPGIPHEQVLCLRR